MIDLAVIRIKINTNTHLENHVYLINENLEFDMTARMFAHYILSKMLCGYSAIYRTKSCTDFPIPGAVFVLHEISF